MVLTWTDADGVEQYQPYMSLMGPISQGEIERRSAPPKLEPPKDPPTAMQLWLWGRKDDPRTKFSVTARREWKALDTMERRPFREAAAKWRPQYESEMARYRVRKEEEEKSEKAKAEQSKEKQSKTEQSKEKQSKSK